MTDVLEVVLALYLSAVAFMLIVGIFYRLMAIRDREKRQAARIIFTAPIWPLLVVLVLRSLWREAEWGRR